MLVLSRPLFWTSLVVLILVIIPLFRGSLLRVLLSEDFKAMLDNPIRNFRFRITRDYGFFGQKLRSVGVEILHHSRGCAPVFMRDCPERHNITSCKMYAPRGCTIAEISTCKFHLTVL